MFDAPAPAAPEPETAIAATAAPIVQQKRHGARQQSDGQSPANKVPVFRATKTQYSNHPVGIVVSL